MTPSEGIAPDPVALATRKNVRGQSRLIHKASWQPPGRNVLTLSDTAGETPERLPLAQRKDR